jgi:hypothetical protein
MLYARPQLNGNTKADFIKAYEDLEAARDAMTKAIRRLQTNVLHGRNYQHIGLDQHPSPMEAQQADFARLRPILTTLELMGEVSMFLAKTGSDT